MPSSRGSSDPGMEPMSLVSLTLAGGLFTTSTTWEAPLLRYIELTKAMGDAVFIILTRNFLRK